MTLSSKNIKKIISDLALYLGSLFIFLYVILCLPEASLPIGFVMEVLEVFFLYFLYLVVNHILLVILKVYTLRYLLFCEALLLFFLIIEIFGVVFLVGTPVK